jgi:hypothetical protein
MIVNTTSVNTSYCNTQAIYDNNMVVVFKGGVCYLYNNLVKLTPGVYFTIQNNTYISSITFPSRINYKHYVPINGYELIETINGTGEFIPISRTKTSEGFPYRFSKMLVRISTVNSDSDNLINVFFNTTPRVLGTIPSALQKQKTIYSWAMAYPENGLMFTETGIGGAYPTSPHGMYGTAYNNLTVAERPITNLTIQTSGTVITDSYTIEIWGVLA